MSCLKKIGIARARFLAGQHLISSAYETIHYHKKYLLRHQYKKRYNCSCLETHPRNVHVR